MKNYDLITPEGTQDLLFGECVARRVIENKIHNIFKLRGYSEIVTSGLEFFDVFSLNSRHFPQENLYKMVDTKGRLIVLRPDSTMPIARVVATRLKDAALPLRLYYNQCAYNVSPLLKGRSDQIVQAGIELIGSSSKLSDLEVISTAIEVLSVCSDDFAIELGDSGFFKKLVSKLGVSEDVTEEIRRFIESKNYPALNDLLDSIGNNSVTNALKNLPRLFGGEEVFEKAAQLFSDPEIDAMLSYLRSVYKDISSICKSGSVTLDLGMVNRTDYYTGVIIKGYIEGYGDAVLSGGRYDKLISEFGYNVPATGFAINVDAAAKVLAGKEGTALENRSDVIVYAHKDCEIKALAEAEKLRKDGLIVEMSLIENLSIDDVKEYAASKGIPKIFEISKEQCSVHSI